MSGFAAESVWRHEEESKSTSDIHNSARISREIDEHLSETKKALDKKKKAAQILLLGVLEETYLSSLTDLLDDSEGQAESGKVRLIHDMFSIAFHY